VLEEGCADGSLRCPGTAEATASMVLSVLEGAMLITRLNGTVDRFTATGLAPTALRLAAGVAGDADPARMAGCVRW